MPVNSVCRPVGRGRIPDAIYGELDQNGRYSLTITGMGDISEILAVLLTTAKGCPGMQDPYTTMRGHQRDYDNDIVMLDVF